MNSVVSGGEGSYGLGLVCGGVFGLWGILGCYVLGKPETQRGSVHGLLARFLLIGVIVAVLATQR